MKIVWDNITITDLINTIGVLITIPTAIYAFFKLFTKDKEQEEKLENLEKLVVAQKNINESLNQQLIQLTKHTEELHKSNLYKIDSNLLQEDKLKLEIQKYGDETRKKYEEIREYIIELLKGMIEPISEQIETLNLSSERLLELKDTPFEFTVVTTIAQKSIENIDNKDLFKAFVFNNPKNKSQKIDSYIKLEKSIAFLNYMKKEFRSDIDAVFKRIDENKSQWGQNISLIQHNFEIYISTNVSKGISPAQDLFASGLDEIFNSWIENKSQVENIRDLYFMRKEYLEPIRLLCNKYIKDPRIHILLRLIVNCEDAFQNIHALRKQLKVILDSYNENLTKN